MRKKLLALLLTMSMVLALPAPAWAAEVPNGAADLPLAETAPDGAEAPPPADGDGSADPGEVPPVETGETEDAPALYARSDWVKYRVTGGNLYFDPTKRAIVDCDTGVTSADIPNSIGGVAVTTIGYYAFFGCSNLSSITIPSSVTAIGEVAFSGCSSLSSVTIPGSVNSIGDSMFRDCSSLSSVSIPNSVTEIGPTAFDGCSNLSSVTISNGVTSIGGYAFCDCTSLSSVTIPGSVTSIGDFAFTHCSSLSSVTILNGVTSIGDGAFYDCSNLSSVTIPDSVTSIGERAFHDCSSLSSVTIPSSVTAIGEGAFADCSGLNSIEVDLANTQYSSVNGVLFNKSQTVLFQCPGGKTIASYIIPNSVTTISGGAFYGCSSLSSVTIPSSVTTISDRAFYGCSSLSSITIPGSVTEIGHGAFYYCGSLSSVTIPYGVTSIGYGAFYNCGSLSSVTIPSSVTAIGEGAFYNCGSLSSVTIPGSVTSIGEVAFNNCGSLSSVTIPGSVTSIGKNAFLDCSSLTDVYYGGDKSQWNAIRIYYNNNSLTSATIHYNFTENPPLPEGIVGTYPESGKTLDLDDPAAGTSSVNYRDGKLRIFFDREVAGTGGRAQLDFSQGTLEIRLASNDRLIYTVTENYMSPGTSSQIPLWGEGADPCTAVRLEGVVPLLTRGEEYYVTLPAGFVKFSDGTASPEIQKGTWIFKTNGNAQQQDFEFGFGTPNRTESVVEGSTVKPVFVLRPMDATVVWDSLDTSVAVVDGDGRITGVNAGTTTIHGIAQYEGQTREYSYTIKVTPGAKVTFKDKCVTLLPDSSAQLSYTVLPTKLEVALTSSDPNIVSVSGNTIRAVGLGTAVITATVRYQGTIKTDTCTVTVSGGGAELAEKFVDMALSVEGQKAGYFGFPADGWCDKFIGWCAKKTGLTNIINGGGSNGVARYKDIINAGGVGVRFYDDRDDMKQGTYLDNEHRSAFEPQIGDIVIFTWGKNKSGQQIISHVGIVCEVRNGRIGVVHGNYSKKVSTPHKPYESSSTWSLNSSEIYAYARPNWAAATTSSREREILYRCPINVRYEYDGEVLDSATGQLEASFGVMELTDEGGILVRLNDCYDVDVTITGTGTGTMNVISTYQNPDGSTTFREFQDVPITEDAVGKHYSGGSAFSEILEMYQDGGNTFTEAWAASVDETASAPDAELTDWYLNGDTSNAEPDVPAVTIRSTTMDAGRTTVYFDVPAGVPEDGVNVVAACYEYGKMTDVTMSKLQLV